MIKIEDLSQDSRVWIYKSDRIMTNDEQLVIQTELNAFIPTWAAHGSELFGASDIVNDWFVVIALDESKSMASGCSIDSLVQVIKKLGAKLNIDFFDRLHVLVTNDNQTENIHFSDLSLYKDWKIYDPMIESLRTYSSDWPVMVSESRFTKK